MAVSNSMTAFAVKLISNKRKLYAWASALALITIFYNIAEGPVSVLFGLEDESMSLFSFGLDSFVEVVSGIGIWHMVRRIEQEGAEKTNRFEQRALRITGTAFFVLTAGLILTSLVEMYRGHKAENTFWGIVISIISILSMGCSSGQKEKTGGRLILRQFLPTLPARGHAFNSQSSCLLPTQVTNLSASAV
jgi:divalent metal cation (Fe/Co/Zn/Cd) transporter